MDAELTGALKLEALRLGFDRVGVASAVEPPDYAPVPRLASTPAARRAWITWRDTSRFVNIPSGCCPGRSRVVMVSLVYGRADATPPGPTEGKVARYDPRGRLP